jgi:hypothetical protein
MDARYKIGKITLERLSRHAKYLVHHALSPVGRMPDVVILGAMKGGTTSLFSYLCEHPEIHGSIRKEVHYFDRHFKRGSVWYRKHFPQASDGVVLEATPDYMFHRSSFDRIRVVLPHAKLIMVLRDPVKRAYSHYHHSRRKGTESRSFEEGVQRDIQWFRERGVPGDDSWQSNDHSYIRRGIYAPQVRRITEVYGNNVLVLRSEDLFAEPLAVTNQALDFIGLSKLRALLEVEPKTAGEYTPEIPMRQTLEEFFLPHNEELYQLLRVEPWWSQPGSAAGSAAAAAA